MDIEKSSTPALAPHQEDYMEIENSCCLCGSDLAFEHDIDAFTLVVKEKAHCTTCGIQLKEKEHLLH